MKKIFLSIALALSAVFYAQDDRNLQALNTQVNDLTQAASLAYENKDYTTAATKFNQLHALLKDNGNENKLYYYYAGLSYALGNNPEQAINIYQDLVNTGYTGVETRYLAKEKKTGKVSDLDKKTWTLLKKSGDYTDFKEEKTPSVEANLFETLAAQYIKLNKIPNAKQIISQGLSKFPNNAKLKELEGVVLMSAGGEEKQLLIDNLKAQLANNPNDANNWYNLGVMYSKLGSKKDAMEAFQKAINLSPKMDDAHHNLVLTIVGDDKVEVEKINSLKKADKMDEATELIEARRERFKEAIPYAENWHTVNPKNYEAVVYLKEFYQVTKNHQKAKEFAEKEATLAK